MLSLFFASLGISIFLWFLGYLAYWGWNDMRAGEVKATERRLRLYREADLLRGMTPDNSHAELLASLTPREFGDTDRAGDRP